MEAGYLYMGFKPSKGEGATAGETLYGPTVATIFSVQGSQHSPVQNFRISGVIFKHVAPSFLGPYAVPSGGDYSLHKGGTVLLNGTEDCIVDHCLFDGNGGNGVFLNDYNRRTLVAANEFKDMGEAVSLNIGCCAFCRPPSTALHFALMPVIAGGSSVWIHILGRWAFGEPTTFLQYHWKLHPQRGTLCFTSTWHHARCDLSELYRFQYVSDFRCYSEMMTLGAGPAILKC
eukprot:SAG31_NODE_11679_length_1007_cov_1.237885_1_plen_231_part_00